MKMKAAGYFRVSDEDQVDGYSLDAQRRDFFEFCRQKGWEAAKTYTEEGRSAWVESIDKRPAFRNMLEDSGSHLFDVVVVNTFDRFSRNVLVTLESFRTLSQNGVTFACVKQDIDYSTPEGRLFMVMLGGFAQYFSDALSGHTKKGMKERAQQGMFNGEPPWGYERCDADCFGMDQGHTGCHVDPDKGPKVLESFEKYSTGTESQSSLGDWLNDLGYRTNGKRRADMFGELVEVDGRLFTSWSIRDMLKNRFYYGKVRYKDEFFDGRHQPIISEKLYGKVQKVMERRRSRRSTTSHYKSETSHLLAGLFRCYECGTLFWAQNQGSLNETYYKSPNKGLEISCKYRGRSFLGRVIDAQMDQLFSGFELREDWIDWIVERHIKGSDIQAALREKQLIEDKMERARLMYLDADINRQRYLKIKDGAEKALLKLYVPEYNDAVEAGKLLGDFGTLWQCSSVARRNAMAKAMMHAVYVNPEEKEIVGLLPKETFLAPVLAMAERSDVAVLDGSNTCSGRNGGDGGESNSPSRRAYKPDVLQACPPVCSWTLQVPPAQPGETQPVNLWPPLPASDWPHPGLMAPGIPSSGNSWEQT